MQQIRRHRLGLLTLAAVVAASTATGFLSGSGSFVTAAGITKGKNKMTEPIVTMETSKGTIQIELFMKDAPITAGNFLDLVKRGFYNGLSFHRYEPGFVIQGGDPKGTGHGGFIDPATNSERRIPLEKKANLKHDAAGIVAMARSNNPDSASSQFYITLAPASFLDNPPGYAVFGKVTSGLEVALQLRAGDKMTKVTVEEPAVK